MFSIPASTSSPAMQPAKNPDAVSAPAAAIIHFTTDDVDMDCDPRSSSRLHQQITADKARTGGFTMAHSFSTSSLDSNESSLADLSLASTMSCSSATSYVSGDDDVSLSLPSPSSALSESTRLVKMALDKYSLSHMQGSNSTNNGSSNNSSSTTTTTTNNNNHALHQSPSTGSPSFFRLAEHHPHQQSPFRQQSQAPSTGQSYSSLGLDLGIHGADKDTLLQQHRHSIAVSSTNGSSHAHHQPSSSASALVGQRANSACLPGLISADTIRRTGSGAAPAAQNGLHDTLSRFKIRLPAISMPDDNFASCAAAVPLTPGGSFFFGARDGAANGVPMSPFNPPTPLVQSGALTAAYEQKLAAEGGILGSAYVSQSQPQQYSPQLYSSPQGQTINSRPAGQHPQQQGQQTGPHRNRIQQKRASLPHALTPMARSASGPMRSPLPRPQTRNGPGSSSPRSSSPLSTSPSGLEVGMSRVAVASNNSSQAFLQMQARLAERYSPTRASMPTATSSSSSSSSASAAPASGSSASTSASGLAAPSLLTPPYSPMNLPGMKEAGSLTVESALGIGSNVGQRDLTPKMTPSNNVLHSVEVVMPTRKGSVSPSYLSQDTSQQQAAHSFYPSPSIASSSAANSPIPEPPAATLPDTIPSPSSLHLQLDVPSAEEIQAIKANSARSAVTSAAMVKSASAPAAGKTVSAQHLSDYNLHPDFAANYTLGDELGSGGFGFVVSALRNSDSFPVAVKFIWKEKVPSQGWVRDRDLGVVPMEVFVLKTVRHPSIIRFIELFDDDQFFYLIMELHGTPWKAPPPKSSGKKAAGAEALQPSQQGNVPAASKPVAVQDVLGGKALEPPRPAPMERRSSCDLFECIEQYSRLNEEQARWVFAQVVEAVYYLDSLGITHRDIKDENCVVDADFNVKLIDFGSAVVSDPRAPAPYFNRFYGTMTFASAEILKGQLYRAPQAEVWSLGVLLSILLSGECPFSDPSAAIKGRISKPKGMWTVESIELMMRCLDVDPNRRATVAELRESPWVRRAWELRGLKRPS
ncbi:hypothetical protein OC844_005977 [Tilletia horrida]|nr:hypothetical protein OC844_005977 [Tilletia horrida]